MQALQRGLHALQARGGGKRGTRLLEGGEESDQMRCFGVRPYDPPVTLLRQRSIHSSGTVDAQVQRGGVGEGRVLDGWVILGGKVRANGSS